MDKNIKYIIVKSDILTFEKEVNEYIKKGFIPLGGVTCYQNIENGFSINTYLIQAMTKE